MDSNRRFLSTNLISYPEGAGRPARKTLFDAHGDRGFESCYLHRRVNREPWLPGRDLLHENARTSRSGTAAAVETAFVADESAHDDMALDDVVMRATAAPAKIPGYEGTVGTRAPGANADIVLFELRDSNYVRQLQRSRVCDRLHTRNGTLGARMPAERRGS
jgi:Amidohydrolase family